MEEREAAMGFERGTTKVAGISNSERSRMLGNAFDLNAMTWLVSSIWAHQRARQRCHMCKDVLEGTQGAAMAGATDTAGEA